MTFLGVFLICLFMTLSTACSFVPLPNKTPEADVIFAKPVSLTTVIPAVEKTTASLTAVEQEGEKLAPEISLQASQDSSIKVHAAHVVTVDAIELSTEVSPSKAPALSAPEVKTPAINIRVEYALDLLKDGDVTAANSVFKQILKQDSHNQTAQYMLSQIHLTPKQFFAKRTFRRQYKVQAGDTFLSIANNRLGNSLDFYALLSLNRRKHINDVRVGETIVLPVDKTAVALAKKSLPSRNHSNIKTKPQNKMRSVIAKTNKPIQQEAEQYYHSAMKELKQGKQLAAFQAFESVLQLQPNNKMALQQLNRLKPLVTQSLYDKAMALYKQQKITAAISNWDRVLTIDPKHELAKTYRGRAIELQERLNKLPKKF